jgi:DnaJ family protein C protein 19
MKLLWLLGLAIVVTRLLTGKWPWQLLRSVRRHLNAPEEKKARALLGVPRNAGHAEIVEAHKRLITLVHPDKGGTNDQVHEANAARDLLLAALQDHR